MPELAVVRVLNVSESWESPRKLNNGQQVVDHWVSIDVEGGQLYVRYDPKEVEVPVGWSGRAVVACYTRQHNYIDDQNKPRKLNYLAPSFIKTFEKGYKHPSLDDVVNSLKK